MAEIVSMPKLGFDMKEGTLVRWVIQEGEKVEKGDVLAEIETDKATVEVEASASGNLYKHLVEKDTAVPIGDPIAVISEEGEEVDLEALLGSGKAEKTETEEESSAEEKSEKDEEQQEQKEQSSEPTHETSSENYEPRIYETKAGERIKASPLARKIAEDKNIDLSRLEGSGPGGRIVKKDVESASVQKPVEEKSAVEKKEVLRQKPTETGVPLPALQFGEMPKKADERTQVNKLRQAIGRRMTQSKQQIPHFYLTHTYEMDELMDLRAQANKTLPEDQQLSVNDFIIKATALTLRQYPNLNSSLDNNEIVRHGSINMGVAVAVEGGLLTIVVRDADLKPIRLISSEVKEMAARVRSGKVRSEDVEGSTFSISNLGMFDVENFAAIINPPESAILAVSSAKRSPVVRNNAVEISWQMKATISVDHRVSDGAEAAKFMKDLAYQIENPLRLLL